LLTTVDVSEPAFFLVSTVTPIGSSLLYISLTVSAAADFGPAGTALAAATDLRAVYFTVAGVVASFLAVTLEGALSPPILLGVLVGVGPDNPAERVPIDVAGLVPIADCAPDGAPSLPAGAVAVGLFNPPPIEPLGLAFSAGALGDAPGPPLDEFKPSPGFEAAVLAPSPRRDGVAPNLPLVVPGVETASFFSVLAEA